MRLQPALLGDSYTALQGYLATKAGHRRDVLYVNYADEEPRPHLILVT